MPEQTPTPVRLETGDHLMGKRLVVPSVLSVRGVRHGSGDTIYLSNDTEVQPDAFLFRDPPSWPDGIRLTSDGYLEGAPELVVEVAASSEEGIVWSVRRQQIDWFRRRAGRCVRLEPDAKGVIESEVFPDLRLAVATMRAGDMAGVAAELRRPNSP